MLDIMLDEITFHNVTKKQRQKNYSRYVMKTLSD